MPKRRENETKETRGDDLSSFPPVAVWTLFFGYRRLVVVLAPYYSKKSTSAGHEMRGRNKAAAPLLVRSSPLQLYEESFLKSKKNQNIQKKKSSNKQPKTAEKSVYSQHKTSSRTFSRISSSRCEEKKREKKSREEKKCEVEEARRENKNNFMLMYLHGSHNKNYVYVVSPFSLPFPPHCESGFPSLLFSSLPLSGLSTALSVARYSFISVSILTMISSLYGLSGPTSKVFLSPHAPRENGFINL